MRLSTLKPLGSAVDRCLARDTTSCRVMLVQCFRTNEWGQHGQWWWWQGGGGDVGNTMVVWWWCGGGDRVGGGGARGSVVDSDLAGRTTPGRVMLVKCYKEASWKINGRPGQSGGKTVGQVVGSTLVVGRPLQGMGHRGRGINGALALHEPVSNTTASACCVQTTTCWPLPSLVKPSYASW